MTPPRPENGRALPWYYTVNDRPVKMVATASSGMDVLVLNMRTGEFERDLSYLSQCFDPNKDVEQLSAAAFNQCVDAVRAELAARKG